MSGSGPAREHPATLLRANTCVALIALTGILLAGIAQLTFLDPVEKFRKRQWRGLPAV